MIPLSQQTEMLARQFAAERGVSVEEAIRLAIEESRMAISYPPIAAGRKLAKEELIRRMEEISRRSGGRPLIDPRSPDELLSKPVQ
jgi:hypothetical protein